MVSKEIIKFLNRLKRTHIVYMRTMSDSFIQIPLPNDKAVYELMNLENKEKIKAIEIGISAIELINEKKLRYENSEYNEKLNLYYSLVPKGFYKYEE